jgi:hypothetical protein
MEYITLILVSAMAVYFVYISYVLFGGIIANKHVENYRWFILQMVIIALVSYGMLALAVYIIKPSVFLKPLLVVGTIISYERIVIVIALVVLAIKYIRRRK